MKLLYTLVVLALSSCCIPVANAQKSSVDVLLLGTFHFDNPGLDMAKFENADVLSARRQAEIQAVVNQLIAFQPDKIFIEAEPSRQARWDSLYRQYQQKKLSARASEIFQLAFPVANAAGHARLYCADYRQAAFPADSLMKVLAANKQHAQLMAIQTTIRQIEQRFNENLKKHTIAEILRLMNTAQAQKDNVGFYLSVLTAGPLDNHVGAYLASEWWRRNLVIYGNILKQLDGNEKRIIILFGEAHTALLRELMAHNKALRLVEVGEVLR